MSAKTAVIAYDTQSRRWYACAMQDANGVYIDAKPVSPGAQALLDDIGGTFHRVTLDTYKAIVSEAEMAACKNGKKRGK